MSKAITKKIEAGVQLSKVDDLYMLFKFRLSLMVVISAVLAYAIAAQGGFSYLTLSFLALGGFAITAAANGINQVLEKDFDVLMERTKNRPIPTGRMSISEAVLYAGMMALFGITILALFNPLSALLGTTALVSYAFVYTPMKRYSTMAVAVGAIPGALPVLIGFAAFEGSISALAMSLFMIQFLSFSVN